MLDTVLEWYVLGESIRFLAGEFNYKEEDIQAALDLISDEDWKLINQKLKV